ncbi:serine hydrolase domain-containing protein [Loigolactobacillus jiayinensis]|uniref:Serine hydrolase domain-containing protein n=1 Tax=Loigolactobacillus jiayinensis TaxID=2486016 RepID=A0ABW1RBN7_9LACO|nr:serine hydrolase domain-containing protein [Loigolactobacillus jiayinensis]
MINDKRETNLYQFLKQTINQKMVSGISYSVLNQNERDLFYLGKVGQKISSSSLNPNMIYDLASLTKVVGTTTRVLQLLANGQINLFDSVSKYVPKFHHSEITIQNLLLHNSGLPNDLADVHQLTRATLINKIFSTNLKSQPGLLTCYSDLGYILLGWVIEKIDNSSLQDSFAKHIFVPLEMKDTGYNLKRDKSLFIPTEIQKQRGGLIQGEVHDYKALLLNGMSGHAGLFSTLLDLCHFTTMLLNGGVYKNKIIIPKTGMELLNRIQYGGRSLGWLCNLEKSQYWHTGFTGTSITFNLKQQQAFICLTNRTYPTRSNTQWIDARKQAFAIFFNDSKEKF